MKITFISGNENSSVIAMLPAIIANTIINRN